MECWSELVSTYPESPEPKHLARALRIASTLLATDLAPFEIEWLVQTFFSKPVNVFNTIKLNKDNEIWFKNLADAFKVISKIVAKYWMFLETESRKFIQLCSSAYDAHTKKEAINCLINVLVQPGVDVGDARRHVDALESATNCKAPLALLVGTICRHHPESVDQDYNRIWRIYLRMLQPQSVTDTLVNAILQGIDGLFENFGRDLPIQELNDFYADLSRKFPKMSKCIAPLLSILKAHASLFKEKLLEDKVIRMFVWGINSANISDALLNMYTVIFDGLAENRIKDIIRSEIQPKTESNNILIKHTALRILFNTRVYNVQTFRPDNLEFQMRYRTLSQQDAELVSICLGSSESFVRTLLATCVTYYDNLPSSSRQEIVVQGIVKASPDDRKLVLTLLIELSRQVYGLEKYADLWRGVINNGDNSDVLAEVLQLMEIQLNSCLDSTVGDEQVLSLTALLSLILSASDIDGRSHYCALFKPIIVELAATMCVSATSLLTPKYVSEEMFHKNTILKEIQSSLQNGEEDDLSAIQTIFTKTDVETKLLIKTLSEMDSLLKEKKDLDHRRVTYIIQKILKLKSKRYTSNMDSRILQRNLTMFVGEHHNLVIKDDIANDTCFMEMKSKLILNIPNVIEGIFYKVELFKLLQISLASEDSEMIYCLLVVISANLRDRPDAGLQSLTWRCIHGLFKCDVDVDVTSALRMCVTSECVRLAIESICNEINPEVRRQLCDSLHIILQEDPGSEKAAQLLGIVGEQLLLMINCPDSPTYESGLDLVRMFLNTLQHNDSLSIKYLPQIIIKMSSKINKDIYKTATELFVDKFDIFDDEQTNNMFNNVIKTMKFIKNKVYLELILMFLKSVIEMKGYDNDMLLNSVFHLSLDTVRDDDKDFIGDIQVFVNVLQILALSKPIFIFSDTEVSSIINNFDTMNKISAVLHQDVEISSIVMFFKEFATELMDVKKEQTIQCFGQLIEKIPPLPSIITFIKKDLTICLQTYKQFTIKNYHNWCNQLKINEISDILNSVATSDIFFIKDKIDSYIDNIKCLNIMSGLYDWPIPVTENWTLVLLANENVLRHDIMSDLLSISVKSLNNFDKILRENENFFIRYLNVYFEKIMDAVIILDKDIFVAVVKMFANNYKKYENYYSKMLDIIENSWPNLEEDNFDDKISIASSFLRLPRDVDSIAPVQWVISVITDPHAKLDHKIRLITILPGGDTYSTCYRYTAGSLPTRVSEMKGDHAGLFRALLDSLATTGDLTLLDIIVTLAAADDTKGWWDDAFDACMSPVADRKDDRIYDAAYEACKKRFSLSGCKRVFVPLLRHSSWLFCEKYISRIIVDVLGILKTGFKEPQNSEIYRTRVLLYAQAFSILQAVFEKLPSDNLESGIINTSAGSQDPWHVVKMVCMYSVTLRDKVRCPDNASDGIKDACLRLQCSAYNCLTTAICKRRPPQKQYVFVFAENAWSKIVDPDAVYDFQPVAYSGDIKKPTSDGNAVASTSFTGTVRTRIFMATLSENPLQYDMIPLDEDDEDVEEYKPSVYEAHPLNAYGCLATITALLEHASSLDHTEWLTKLIEGLRSEIPVNAKWTLAQAICNTQTELMPHASVLTPALLDLISNTPQIVDGKQILNNLHIDILWTIIKWNVLEADCLSAMNTCLKYIIVTCIEYRNRESVSRRLLATLNNLLTSFGSKLRVDWRLLQPYCNDLPFSASYLMPILQRILKNGIPLPDLLPVIFAKCDAKQWMTIPKLPEVFGLALSLEPVKDDMLVKFWQILANVKSLNIAKFVRMLLYTQRQCHQCCNSNFFRIITDLAPKAEKSKCLTIISVYLDNLVEDDGFCSEVFETIALKELLGSDYSVEAMKVVHGGFKFMEEHLRNDIVSLVIHNCRSSSVNVRKQAFTVILKVFQELVLPKDYHGPKRVASSNSPILSTMEAHIEYHRTIVQETSRGLFDKNEDIAKMVKDGVEMCLSKDMAMRTGELFYIIFYFANADNSLSVYGYVFLELLFSDLRKHEGFKNSKISDIPLPSGDNSYLTYATTGTTINNANTRRDINVVMPVADIFESFLQSAKDNTQICQELAIQVLRRLQGTGRRFDLDEVIAKLLTDVIKKEPTCLTPLYLEVSRIFLNSVATVTGFRDSLIDLKFRLHNSNALLYYNILYEDLLLRKESRELFIFSDHEDTDVKMKYEEEEFSIQSTIEIFGRLSNWYDLRTQDKKAIEKSLPPIMVHREMFETNIHEYFDILTSQEYKLWFNKMVGAYYYCKDKPIVQYKEDWLKDIERWPTREFTTSAIIEAIKWTQGESVEACDINTSDCLIEWAARLMVRSAHHGEGNKMDELKWCSEANIRGLPHLALQCIERNKHSLLENEALSWFYEKVKAQRLIALKQHDVPMLQKALEVAENHDTDSMFCFKKLILQLRIETEDTTIIDICLHASDCVRVVHSGISTARAIVAPCILKILQKQN